MDVDPGSMIMHASGPLSDKDAYYDDAWMWIQDQR
jgi:hypothetical protein